MCLYYKGLCPEHPEGAVSSLMGASLLAVQLQQGGGRRI